jgi:hypothetical protein
VATAIIAAIFIVLLFLFEKEFLNQKSNGDKQ